MANNVPLFRMVLALLDSGISERQLGEILDASQSTVHRMKDPEHRASDALGQRVRAAYRRLQQDKQRDPA